MSNLIKRIDELEGQVGANSSWPHDWRAGKTTEEIAAVERLASDVNRIESDPKLLSDWLAAHGFTTDDYASNNQLIVHTIVKEWNDAHASG